MPEPKSEEFRKILRDVLEMRKKRKEGSLKGKDCTISTATDNDSDST